MGRERRLKRILARARRPGIGTGNERLPGSQVEQVIVRQAKIQIRKGGKSWFNWAEIISEL